MLTSVIGIIRDTDLFFTDAENRETYTRLMENKTNLHYHTISSVHGHDAFLIEYKQLERIVSSIFDFNEEKKRIKVLKCYY